nr:MAG TPA: Histone H3.2, Histone H4, Histone, Chromatin, Nucleosome, DNA, SNF2h [Crassvirales sp.]
MILKLDSAQETRCRSNRVTVKDIVQIIIKLEITYYLLDVKGLSVAINLGLDSSEIKAVQKLGRIIRFEEGKEAEMFNIVINNTAEVTWFKNSHKNSNYITIDEQNLKKILNNEEYSEYTKPIPKLSFRF